MKQFLSNICWLSPNKKELLLPPNSFYQTISIKSLITTKQTNICQLPRNNFYQTISFKHLLVITKQQIIVSHVQIISIRQLLSNFCQLPPDKQIIVGYYLSISIKQFLSNILSPNSKYVLVSTKQFLSNSFRQMFVSYHQTNK